MPLEHELHALSCSGQTAIASQTRLRLLILCACTSTKLSSSVSVHRTVLRRKLLVMDMRRSWVYCWAAGRLNPGGGPPLGHGVSAHDIDQLLRLSICKPYR